MRKKFEIVLFQYDKNGNIISVDKVQSDTLQDVFAGFVPVILTAQANIEREDLLRNGPSKLG